MMFPKSKSDISFVSSFDLRGGIELHFVFTSKDVLLDQHSTVNQVLFMILILIENLPMKLHHSSWNGISRINVDRTNMRSA